MGIIKTKAGIINTKGTRIVKTWAWEEEVLRPASGKAIGFSLRKNARYLIVEDPADFEIGDLILFLKTGETIEVLGIDYLAKALSVRRDFVGYIKHRKKVYRSVGYGGAYRIIGTVCRVE